jgi:hypothetical protein
MFHSLQQVRRHILIQVHPRRAPMRIRIRRRLRCRRIRLARVRRAARGGGSGMWERRRGRGRRGGRVGRLVLLLLADGISQCFFEKFAAHARGGIGERAGGAARRILLEGGHLSCRCPWCLRRWRWVLGRRWGRRWVRRLEKVLPWRMCLEGPR